MTEEESIETLKSWLEYNKKHKNILREADKIIAVQETILNLIQKLQEENKKKDKIIDLMAFLVASKIGTRTVICKNMNCDKTDIENCKICAIQYSEKKASDVNENI